MVASLKTPSGDDVPEDDPRIPRRSQIEKQEATANELVAFLRKLPTGQPIAVLEVVARVEALVSLLVPPEGPVRSLYEFRVQENRARNAQHAIQTYQAAKAEAERPKLVIARADVSEIVDQP